LAGVAPIRQRANIARCRTATPLHCTIPERDGQILRHRGQFFRDAERINVRVGDVAFLPIA